jgi:hypothetical protein
MNKVVVNNSLRLKVYPPGSSDELVEQELNNAQAIRFSTCYPGGKFNECTFFIARKITAPSTLALHQRVKLYNGFENVWEGEITGLSPTASPGQQGLSVTCQGYWTTVLMERSWRKPWADSRIDDSVWQEPSALFTAGDITGLKYCNVDRQNRIRFTPRSTRNAAGAETGWASGQYHRVCYTVPTGQTIQRITFDYDLQTGAQSWQMRLYNGAVTSLWLTVITGTGSQDIALGANANQSVSMLFWSAENQTPPSDGTIYGEFSNIVVYTETGAINPTEIITDVRGRISELSSATNKISTNTLSMVPYVADPPKTLADIITDAASYGDASLNAWACYVDSSGLSTDDKPVLIYEQQPALTGYDYQIRLDAATIEQVGFTQDLDGVKNWIAVIYQDANGKTQYITPDDDATLKNTASIAAYGQREEWLTVNSTHSGLAVFVGQRYLAQYKDPQWSASNSIPIKGYCRDASGAPVPACRIQAGKRLRIANFLNDLNGSGLTFLVTMTDYDASTQTCNVTVGVPTQMDVLLARIERASHGWGLG